MIDETENQEAPVPEVKEPEPTAERVELLEIAQRLSIISASIKYPGVTDSHSHAAIISKDAMRIREIARGME